MPAAIRPARALDLEALDALERAAFGADALPALALRQYLDVFDGLVLVAEREAAIVGAVFGGLRSAAPRDGWILGLAVDPAHRRQGLGDALLRGVLPRLDAAGAGQILATVHPDNTASRALFVRHRFAEAGLDPAYFGPGRPRLRLVRPSTGLGPGPG